MDKKKEGGQDLNRQPIDFLYWCACISMSSKLGTVFDII